MNVSIDCFSSAREFGVSLAHDLASAQEANIAVAFAKESALRRLDLTSFVNGGGRLRLVAGTDFFLTELDLLRRLEEHVEPSNLRLFHSPDDTTFHPKVYCLDRGDTRIAYVGSSNLTSGGLFSNVEANVRMEGPLAAPEIQRVSRMFHDWFDSEHATSLDPLFAERYDELQKLKQSAERSAFNAEAWASYRNARQHLKGEYRALYASARWFLVTTPTNYQICMNTRTWGREKEHEVRAYHAGDPFVFHVTGGHGLRALGMFTGQPYHDDRPLWPDARGRVFPWRVRFEILAELRTGLPTAAILKTKRPEAPGHWFNGFVQQSHALEVGDFEILRHALEMSAAGVGSELGLL